MNLKERIIVEDIEHRGDHRGSFSVIVDGDTIKDKEFGSLIVAMAAPGTIRGNHYHKINTDYLVVTQGRALLGFVDSKTNERLEFEVTGDKPQRIFVPTGVSHAVKNIGEEDVEFVEYSSLKFSEKIKDLHDLEVFSVS